MISRIALIASAVFLMGVSASSKVHAKACSAGKLKEIYAQATPGARNIVVDCDLRLKRGSVITKQLVFKGRRSEGVTLDCNGAKLDGRRRTVNAGRDMLVVRSQPKGERWIPATGVRIRNCTVLGSVKIYGVSRSGEGKHVRALSRYRDATKRIQGFAPRDIVLDNMNIVAQGRIPLYLAPGVTRVTLTNSRFQGHTTSVAIYLDMESSHNRIINNHFGVATIKREVIAVDGSAHNVIKGNLFTRLSNGGIYVYRNCGEGGTIRHQKPRYNEIVGNGFFYKRFKGVRRTFKSLRRGRFGDVIPAVWVGSRNGNRKYCEYDRGYDFGSSKSNADFADFNVVANNQFLKLDPNKMIVTFSNKNEVYGNRVVRKLSLSGLRQAAKRSQAQQLDPTTKPKKRAKNAKVRKKASADGTVTFGCKVKNNNTGCRKIALCPAGQRIRSVAAICNLETSSLKKNQLARVGDNLLVVSRHSDFVQHGHCQLGNVDIAQGFADLTAFLGREGVRFGCQEFDRNGGDCAIKGRLVCR